MSRVLLVGLPPKERVKVEDYFKSVGVPCDSLPTIDAALERIPTDPPSLILVENPNTIDPLNGLAAVLKTNAPTTSYVVTMPEQQVERALDIMRAGAYDCVSRPYDRLQILAAAKRAALLHGRTLFSAKVEPPKKHAGTIIAAIVALFLLGTYIHAKRNGPPEYTQNLGAATLSGLQWEEGTLWVGNWFDSTITHHKVKKSFFRRWRVFETEDIFRMADSQPILVCNTPESLITVGFDLKIRSHQRAVGLPTLQAKQAPGPNPTGLAWDGSHVWSIDGQTGMIYKHGMDLQALESIKSLLPQPTGLTFDGESFWVIGGNPMQLAKMTVHEDGVVWQGPYSVPNLLPAGVTPSGVSAGFGRLWWVSGGDPRMFSKSLEELTRKSGGWEAQRAN